MQHFHNAITHIARFGDRGGLRKLHIDHALIPFRGREELLSDETREREARGEQSVGDSHRPGGMLEGQPEPGFVARQKSVEEPVHGCKKPERAQLTAALESALAA